MDSPTALAQPFLTFNGPVLIGTFVDFLLFGVLIMQIYHWRMTERYQRASTWIHYLVYAATFFQTVQIIFAIIACWILLVENWGNPLVWASTPWASTFIPALDSMTSTLVQFFFAWRIRVLSKHILGHIMVALVLVTSLMQCGASWAVSVSYFLKPSVTELPALANIPKTMLSSGAICDCLISFTMVFLLLKARSKVTFKSTIRMLNRTLANVIESGTITAVVVLLELVTFLKLPNTGIFLTFQFMVGKLYANVLLSSLSGNGGVGTSVNYTSSQDSRFPSTGNGMPMNSIPSNVRSHQREQGGDSVQVHIAKAVASDMDFDADGQSDKDFGTGKVGVGHL
ncbi:hypothetical protein CPB85DRAFT_1307626 [Mucidula mucida]|nr:hypothetical protein CPB85DRAFT_1307626 [Mucidula mucida]